MALRMTESEFAEFLNRKKQRDAAAPDAPVKAPQRGSKYGNRKTERDGLRFDSRYEAGWYETLRLRGLAGEFYGLARQVTFFLPGGVKYIADFVTLNTDGTYTVLDAKSEATRKDKVPKHLMLLFCTMRGKLDRDCKKYSETCERRKQAAIAREAKKRSTTYRGATVHSCDNSARLSQQAPTATIPVTKTVPVTETYTKPNTTTYPIEQIKELWNVLWSEQATQSDAAAFQRMVNDGYSLEDIQQAMRQAHERADDNPIGYMFSLLRVWKENGKPKRPRESREIMQRHSDEERQKMIASAVIDLDYEE